MPGLVVKEQDSYDIHSSESIQFSFYVCDKKYGSEGRCEGTISVTKKPQSWVTKALFYLYF